MQAINEMKSQRDRFLAFSMAAADLLIEADRDGVVSSTYGATKALLKAGDIEDERDIFALFVPQDRPFLRRLLSRVWQAGRIEPTVLRLRQADGDPVRVTFGACRIPDNDLIYITFTVLSSALCALLPATDAMSGLVDPEAFSAMATQSAASQGDRESGGDIRLIHIEGLTQSLNSLPARRNEQLMSEIGALLRQDAIGGAAASQLAPEKFAVLTRTGDAQEDYDARFAEGMNCALAGVGLPAHAMKPSIVNIALDTANLDPEHAGKAIAFALQTFEKGSVSGLKNLEACLAAAIEVTTGRYNKVKAMIAAGEFELHYQPVVNLKTRSIHHYEALTRFAGGKSPYETVRFSEETGLIQELDLSATARTIEALSRHGGASLAVNISGASIENERFRNGLISLLASSRRYSDRLSFEITESAQIQDLQGASRFLKAVRDYGFKLSLDDFGAGAAGYSYLRSFEVDFVKIDGAFFQAAMTDWRQRALLHSMAVLCADLKCDGIAEMIETEAQLQLALELGISFGQGYLLGRPLKTLPASPLSGMNVRRQGATESWA